MAAKRVAMIGAGASGLVQTKQVLDAFGRRNLEEEVEVVVFESKDEVGGVWYAKDEPKAYLHSFSSPSSASVGNGEPGPSQAYVYPPRDEDPSPMYEGLHTNLPCDLMAFREFEFPDDTPAFPDRSTVQQYLEEYATFFGLRRHIRFKHSVTRLYLTPSSPHSALDSPNGHANGDRTSLNRRWTLEYRTPDEEAKEELFDFVCVANGHYADGWIPPIPGLELWKGTLLHSRFFRRASDFAGKRVLVVGSFASGGDISRLIAGLNVGNYAPDGSRLDNSHSGTTLPNGSAKADWDEAKGGYTKVYVSASGPSLHSVDPNDPTSIWAPYITWLPLIDHITPPIPTAPNGVIHLKDGQEMTEVDVILFATGYNYTYPFLKRADAPWSTHPILDGGIKPVERTKGHEEEVGGLTGLGMKGLDSLMMFLEGDTSIAFPALQYQLVPFPMAETQARLAAFVWAGLLDSTGEEPLPPNPNNPYSALSPTGKPTVPNEPNSVNGSAHGVPIETIPTPKAKPPRQVFTQRQALVFGSPYEWTYQDHLMDLMLPAYPSEDEVPEEWRRIPQWRKDRRADAGLRKKVLGY